MLSSSAATLLQKYNTGAYLNKNPTDSTVCRHLLNVCILLHLLDFYSHWITMHGTTSLTKTRAYLYNFVLSCVIWKLTSFSIFIANFNFPLIKKNYVEQTIKLLSFLCPVLRRTHIWKENLPINSSVIYSTVKSISSPRPPFLQLSFSRGKEFNTTKPLLFLHRHIAEESLAPKCSWCETRWRTVWRFSELFFRIINED